VLREQNDGSHRKHVGQEELQRRHGEMVMHVEKRNQHVLHGYEDDNGRHAPRESHGASVLVGRESGCDQPHDHRCEPPVESAQAEHRRGAEIEERAHFVPAARCGIVLVARHQLHGRHVYGIAEYDQQRRGHCHRHQVGVHRAACAEDGRRYGNLDHPRQAPDDKACGQR